MKRIEDIEKMDAEELETAAFAQNDPVPEGLKERLENALAAKTVADKSAPKPDPDAKKPVFKPSGKKLLRWIPYVGIAAAIIVVVLAINNKDRELIDTFDDPALAYAQVEDAFKQISDKMARGVEMASKAGAVDKSATNNE